MSDKTYAETKGLPAFDWWKAIDHPEDFDHEELCAKAEEWTTCACGNQCAIIPRMPDDQVTGMPEGAPADGHLRGLGCRFYSDVRSEMWQNAKETLRQIEVRSETLIAEELAKLRSEPVTTAGA